MPETICNTSPIQYLFQCGLLDLLRSLYGEVVIPKAVAAEIHQGRAKGISLPAIDLLGWARIKGPNSPAILDDALARRYAAHLGIRLTGTLGILLRAKQQRLVSAVAPIIDQLDQLHFRLDPATRKAVLGMADESSAE